MACSSTYNVEMIDEIRPRIDGAVTVLAAAAMSGTPLSTDEMLSMVKLLDHALRLLAFEVSA